MIGVQFFSDQFQNRCVTADGSVVGGSNAVFNGPLCAVADVAYFGLRSNMCGNHTTCLRCVSDGGNTSTRTNDWFGHHAFFTTRMENFWVEFQRYLQKVYHEIVNSPSQRLFF